MTHPDIAARERTRWFRCNAHLWVRPDAARFLAPGADLHAASPALATKYSPNQPRVPAGSGRESGRWTDGSGNERPRVIIDTTDWDGDPGFDAPGADSDIDAPGSMRDDAFDDGRPYDTRLASNEDKPRLGQNSRVAILAEIGRRLIRAFRSENGLFDLFNHDTGTVSHTQLDGRDVFGSNSTSPTYTFQDREAADRMRDILMEKYPDKMKVGDIGQSRTMLFITRKRISCCEAQGKKVERLPGVPSRFMSIVHYAIAAGGSFHLLDLNLAILRSP